jgi:hypothetical protein
VIGIIRNDCSGSIGTGDRNQSVRAIKGSWIMKVNIFPMIFKLRGVTDIAPSNIQLIAAEGFALLIRKIDF